MHAKLLFALGAMTLFSPVASPLAFADDKPAAPAAMDAPTRQLLQQYLQLKPPVADRVKAQDQAYVAEYRKKLTEWQAKRAEMAEKILPAAPDHAALAAMLQEATAVRAKTDRAAAYAFAKDYVAAHANHPQQAKLAMIQAACAVQMTDSTDEQLAAVDAAAKLNPGVPQLGALYMQIAGEVKDQAKRRELLQKVAADYPQFADAASGQLKLIDAVGKPFELSFTDAIGGKPVSIEGLKGKVVVVDFWATWCPPCVAEMPKMKDLYAKYKDKGVEFVGVSLDQSEAQGGLKKLKAFVAENQIGWPQYYQGDYWNSAFSKGWGINSIPRVFIVDAEGKLYSTEARGKLDTLIPELLAKRPSTASR